MFIAFLFMVVLLTGLQSKSYGQRFEGGVLGGLNASQVDGDHTSGYHKPGVLFGGYVQTDISRTSFVGAELKYSQKGSRKNPNPKLQDQEKYIMRLGYIDVPAYLGIRTGETVSVFTGLSFGYLMQSAEYDNYGELPEIERRPFNNFDFQAFLGVRFELTDRLKLDVRGAYSFVPIRDLPGDRIDYWWDDQYNNVLSTTLLYRLDF
jgi:opacity protein-like surface antigen